MTTNTVKHTPGVRCPFCDGRAEVAYNGPTPEQIQNARSWGDDVDWQFYGQCTHCYATGPACVSASEAAAAWNRRAGGWQDMATAPLDGTHILAVLYRGESEDMDGYHVRPFWEIREIWYQPYTQLGMFLPWHAGDPFDSHEGMAPDHMGEAVPVGWLQLTALPPAPQEKGR